jgi:hypothetical protein
VPKPLAALELALGKADALPFLFVGSGVSRHFLGHESWEGLLRWASTLVGRPYEYYATRANSDLARAASLIAAEFHEVWFNDPAYESARATWMSLCETQVDPLKVEIARHLATIDKPLKATSSEFKLLQKCNVDGVVTTNYDHLLEQAFPAFQVYVGQEQLLLQRSYQLAEIYKIHGSIDDPTSLVLCEEDYRKFADESTYLAAKLMSVFVEHPIVFLGYSLRDPNVRTVLASLLRCLSDEAVQRFRSRFIFVESRSAVTRVEQHTIDVGDGRLLPILRVQVPTFEPVLKVLAGTKRYLPVALLRRVEENVVEIVHGVPHSEKLKVAAADIGHLTNFDDVEFVVGVGSMPSTGLVGLHRPEILRGVLAEDHGYDSGVVVRDVLPHLIKTAKNAYWPVCRYVSEAGIPEAELPQPVSDAMNRSPAKVSVPKGLTPDSTFELEAACLAAGDWKGLTAWLSVPDEHVHLSKVRASLTAREYILDGTDANLKSAYGRAIWRYDQLRYRPPAVLEPTTAAEKREWARRHGWKVSNRGPLPIDVRDALARAFPASADAAPS